MILNISFDAMKLQDLDKINLSNFDDFWNESILREELSIPSSHYLIAKYENDIIGFAGVKYLLDEAHITNIAVRKDKRNNRYSAQNF